VAAACTSVSNEEAYPRGHCEHAMILILIKTK